MAEAELVRRLNEEFSRRAWPHRDYARFMRYGAVEHMKDARQPAPDEPRIATPAWALARAAEISAEMARNTRRSVSTSSATSPRWASCRPRLARTADPAAEAMAGPPMVPVEVAARAALGAFIAGGAGGQITEEIVRELDARSLAKVLARRCRQRVRRAFVPVNPNWAEVSQFIAERCFAGMSQRKFRAGD